MKKHVKKIIVLVANSFLVIFGVFLIKNHEKNKAALEQNSLSDAGGSQKDSEVQNSTVGGEANILTQTEEPGASILEDSSSATETGTIPSAAQTPSVKNPVPSPAPTVPKASVPKTKTS